MYVCKIENVKHDILTLTQNEGDFQILSIDGLYPPQAQINRSTVAGMDGSKFNSSKLNERAITITLKLNGDIEKNRIKLYSYFNTKQWCKFYYKNETRDVYIEGWTETHNVPQFTNNELAQITILCPNPYFKAIDEIIDDVSKVIEKFEFPFAFGANGATNINASSTGTDNAIVFSEIDTSRVTNVVNNSESQTGLIINVDFLKDVNKLLIKNTGTGEEFILDRTKNGGFIENDRVIIDTNKGSKSVTLIRNAQEINIFPSLKKGSVFFQLDIGDNYFSYLADDGTNDDGVSITFKHYTIYGGV